MSTPRLVVLSVSAGAGHVRAAAALCDAARRAGVDAVHCDVLQSMPRWFRWLYADFYATLVNRAPLLWSWLYGRMNRPADSSAGQRLRRAIERRLSKRWLAEVAALHPHAIVCTHFLPAEVLTRTPIACPVFVHVTDFDLHAMWVQPDVCAYFAGNEEVAYLLRRAGVAPARIHVSGIAILPAFHQAVAALDLAAEYGLDGSAPVVLLMGGGGGFGGLASIAGQLLAAAEDFQLLVLAGRNAATLAALQAMAPRWPGRLAALGFTDRVAQLMASADVVITKPGGLSTAECLAMGVTMIVNTPIPGQEERNADYLLEQGAALKAVDAASLAWRLRQLLAAPRQRVILANKARALGRPDAASVIIDHVLAAIAADLRQRAPA